MGRAKIRTVLAFAVSVATSALAHGDEYPNRSIKLMQPATAGGFSDTMSRLIAQGLSTHLGQTVFIENRPGAMNMLANKLVSRSEPDGYTLLWGPIDMTMAPALRKDAAGFSGQKT